MGGSRGRILPAKKTVEILRPKDSKNLAICPAELRDNRARRGRAKGGRQRCRGDSMGSCRGQSDRIALGLSQIPAETRRRRREATKPREARPAIAANEPGSGTAAPTDHDTVSSAPPPTNWNEPDEPSTKPITSKEVSDQRTDPASKLAPPEYPTGAITLLLSKPKESPVVTPPLAEPVTHPVSGNTRVASTTKSPPNEANHTGERKPNVVELDDDMEKLGTDPP